MSKRIRKWGIIETEYCGKVRIRRRYLLLYEADARYADGTRIGIGFTETSDARALQHVWKRNVRNWRGSPIVSLTVRRCDIRSKIRRPDVTIYPFS